MSGSPKQPLGRRLWRSRTVQHALGSLLAGYLKLVGRTTRFIVDPPDALDRAEQRGVFICAMWHGQHLMVPLALRPSMRFATLISHHADGEINAIAASRFGIALVRGSGGETAEQVARRGGVRALREMIAMLRNGVSMCFTADVPKTARVAGKGIVTLARHSGRPIVPIAVVTRRRIAFPSWDRASIGTPFNRGAIVLGDAIVVAADADEAAIEEARMAVQRGLDAAHARAYALAGGVDPGARSITK